MFYYIIRGIKKQLVQITQLIEVSVLSRKTHHYRKNKLETDISKSVSAFILCLRVMAYL